MKRTDKLWDAVIIGGGPAGLSAGTHLARAGYCALLIERRVPGGQARCIERVENYPGFPRGIPGAKLMDLWLEQAVRRGLAVKPGEAVALASGADGIFSVRLKNGGALRARSVLWCAGAEFRKLGVPGEDRLLGKGVWNTADEAPANPGRTAAVIGGGEAAVQQAAALARTSAKVYLISRVGKLKAHRLLLKRLGSAGVLRVPGFSIARLLGKDRLEAVELKSADNGETVVLKAGALFTLIGKEPLRPPAAWRSTPPGFFEAGDAAAGVFRQVAIAGGDGIRAAMRCIRYLEGM